MAKSHGTILSSATHACAKMKISPSKRSHLSKARLIAACAIAATTSCLTLAGNGPANAATITWTDASGSHTWSTNTNWNPNGTPGSTSDVVIGSPASAATPSLDDISTTIANLTVDLNSELDIAAGINTNIATGGTITDNGVIKVNSTAGDFTTGLGIQGTVSLTGSGTIVLNAVNNNNSANLGTARVFDGGSSNLTQDVGHTISGTGMINVDTFTNNGTVNADVNGNTLLLITNVSTYTNNNIMEATNGGTLAESNTPIQQGTAGVIEANGGNVILNGGSITGGTLTSASGGEIDEQNNTTLSGITLSSGSNLYVLDGNRMMFNAGTITNNGTITVNKGGTSAVTGINIVGNVELAGTGAIVLNAVNNNNGANLGIASLFDGGSSNLTQDVGHTISGTGMINVDTFTNNGTVNADVNGNTLLLITNVSTYTNNNIMEATNGGTLAESNTPIQQGTAGVIEANGGNVILNGGSITGGTLTSASGGEIDEQNNTTLSGITLSSGSNLYVLDGNRMMFNAGTITNNGTITVNKGGTSAVTGINIVGNVELAGTGAIVLNAVNNNNGANLGIASLFDGGSSNLTQDVGHTISGTGMINVDTFTNNGTVNADVNGNTLLLITNVSTYTNNNIMEATNGGTLAESNTPIQQGTAGVIEANGGNVILNGGSITGGTLTSASGGEIDEQNNTTLSGITLSSGSNLYVLDGNRMMFNAGTITNNGTITVNKGGTSAVTGINIVGNVELAGTGAIVLNAVNNNNSANLGSASISDGGSSNLTQDSGHTISGTGYIAVNNFTNNGTVNADVNGNTLQVGRANTNNGTYEATLGGTLNISSLSNYSSGTLTGGIYKAINTGSLVPSTIILNSGNITTNAADVTLSGTNAIFAQINTLAVNQGEFRVLANRNFTAQAAFDNQGSAILQLGGGTFAISSGALTNEGEIDGFGVVTPRVQNAGTVMADGGTLVLLGGAVSTSGTSLLQTNAGATLDVSRLANNTTSDLTNNGSLALGSSNVTVSSDYQNANFGTGNSFNPHANVNTTGGKILATGNTDLTVTGSDVTLASSTPALNTYTMNFGNVHVNSSATLTYNLTNPGNSGPIIRGAIQTTVNGGNITDSRLSGNGVLPGNGSLGLGQTTSANDVTFTPGGQGGALAGQVIHIEGNFDNIHQDNINITGTVWNLAAPSVSPTIINLGDVHVGGSVTQNIAVGNTAPNDGFSEQLDGQLGTGSGNLSTNGGTFSGLSAGSSLTPANALNVTLDTSAAGIRSGSATLALQSDGTGTSGLGITTLTPQTISMAATAFRLANPVVNSPTGTTINLGVIHVGDVGTQNISLTNKVLNDGFSENLNAGVGSLTGSAFAVTNPNPVVLTPGSTNAVGSLQVGVSTAVAGSKSGTATLNLISDGTGIDTLGKTTLTPIVYNISATVNNYALPTILLQSGSSGAVLHEISSTQYSLNLGTTTQGAGNLFADLGFGNGATGPSDTLAGNFNPNAASFNLSGFNNFTDIGAGQNTTGQNVTLSDITAGTFSGSITYNPFGQNSSGYNSAFSPITIDLGGTVHSSTPEPTTLALLAIGGLGLLLRKRRVA